MSKIRDRAQAAATHPAVASHLRPEPRDYAEAVSDVWEPLLTTALIILTSHYPELTEPEQLAVLNLREQLR